MTALLPKSFSTRIANRIQEREALRCYPVAKLAVILQEVGFSCTLCARCCTRAFNGHVLLLEEDTERIRSIDPSGLEPPPEYDFCDQHGIFYVSGFTIRARPGGEGSCHFLESRRCRIYDARPWICRVYPYMLHREPDGDGVVDWRQISGLDQHGEYHSCIPDETSHRIAHDVKAFEEAVLTHEISFLEYSGRYFQANGLRHVRKRYDDGIRALGRGAAVTVMVYHKGSFEEWIVQGGESTPEGKKIKKIN